LALRNSEVENPSEKLTRREYERELGRTRIELVKLEE
jgi:hypothetical protein